MQYSGSPLWEVTIPCCGLFWPSCVLKAREKDMFSDINLEKTQLLSQLNEEGRVQGKHCVVRNGVK